MSFVALLEDDVSVELEVEDHLLYHVVGLEHSVLVGELGQVVGGLGVVGVQGLDDLLFLLLGSELLLVDAAHLVVLVHVEQVGVVLQVLALLFLRDCALLLVGELHLL